MDINSRCRFCNAIIFYRKAIVPPDDGTPEWQDKYKWEPFLYKKYWLTGTMADERNCPARAGRPYPELHEPRDYCMAMKNDGSPCLVRVRHVEDDLVFCGRHINDARDRKRQAELAAKREQELAERKQLEEWANEAYQKQLDEIRKEFPFLPEKLVLAEGFRRKGLPMDMVCLPTNEPRVYQFFYLKDLAAWLRQAKALGELSQWPPAGSLQPHHLAEEDLPGQVEHG